MIKKKEDWNLSEHHAHAKGLLEGILWGVALSVNVLVAILWLFF